MITVLNHKINVTTKKESEIAYDATNLAVCNMNLDFAIKALKNITHDPSQSALLSAEQLDSVRKLLDVLK